MLCGRYTRCDLPSPCVTTYEAGLSDHGLIQWTVPVLRPDRPVVSVDHQPWHQLDATAMLHEALRVSRLCRLECWTDCSVDDLASLYNNELELIMDALIHVITVTCRRRPSDPWFDRECRLAKRRVRNLERKANSSGLTDSIAAWMNERRIYRNLLRSKRERFWTEKVESEKSSARQLWSSIDTLLGRGITPPSDVTEAGQFY